MDEQEWFTSDNAPRLLAATAGSQLPMLLPGRHKLRLFAYGVLRAVESCLDERCRQLLAHAECFQGRPLGTGLADAPHALRSGMLGFAGCFGLREPLTARLMCCIMTMATTKGNYGDSRRVAG